MYRKKSAGRARLELEGEINLEENGAGNATGNHTLQIQKEHKTNPQTRTSTIGRATLSLSISLAFALNL